MWLFVAFVAVPIIEIALFIQVGGAIGTMPTIGIVILTAFIGTWLMRTQGRLAMGNLQRSFSEMQDPTEPLAHAAMILVAGVLLLTPGFFTDALGLGLLIPAFRAAVFLFLRSRVRVHQFGQRPSPGAHPNDPRARRTHSKRPDVIEGEYEELDPDDIPPRGQSGWTRH
ncbi:MAG: FxsA family protein [Sediminimonas qiaohouensis]|uniref:FxsA family protein n=1 Tax=Sediminimonas qiaohouensis TaxID=552061 RepID=A0A7C9LRZ0_9RHOB|nr:FxsA family protein [Sediminimonas qiaohouensis]MTJ04616.1 FxsA family protein [Sediminimonas qiaohouensis]